MKNILTSGVLLLSATVGVDAQVPSAPAPQPVAAASPVDSRELDALKLQEKTLKNRIALVQDTIATYKGWFSHPMTAAQRQETKDRIEQQKGVLENYQTQLSALQDKIKALNPAASASSATPDPKWPFKH